MARPKSDIQERILSAAHLRFLAEGVEAASLRHIAKDAETSIGMVYYYYTTKDELFFAVVEETYSQLLLELGAIFKANSSYQERMQAFYLRLGSLAPREVEVVQLIIREAMSSSERRGRLLSRFLRGHLPLLLRAVLDGIETGELDKGLHPLVIMACSVGIGGLPTVMFRLASNRIASADQEVPGFMRVAIEELIQQLPSHETMATLLSGVLMRAVGAKS